MITWVWVIVCVVLLVLILLWFSPVRMNLFFSRVKEDDQLYFEIAALFGLIKYRYDVPIMKYQNQWGNVMFKTKTVNKNQGDILAAEEEPINPERILDDYRKVKILLSHVLDFPQWVRNSLCHVYCTKFQWITRVGIGDAPKTAVITGMVWGLKSSLLGYIFKFIQLDTKPKIWVQPQYNETHFSSELSCIGKIRLGYAIHAGLLLIVRILKVKGGIRVWQNILFKA